MRLVDLEEHTKVRQELVIEDFNIKVYLMCRWTCIQNISKRLDRHELAQSFQRDEPYNCLIEGDSAHYSFRLGHCLLCAPTMWSMHLRSGRFWIVWAENTNTLDFSQNQHSDYWTDPKNNFQSSWHFPELYMWHKRVWYIRKASAPGDRHRHVAGIILSRL